MSPSLDPEIDLRQLELRARYDCRLDGDRWSRWAADDDLVERNVA